MFGNPFAEIPGSDSVTNCRLFGGRGYMIGVIGGTSPAHSAGDVCGMSSRYPQIFWKSSEFPMKFSISVLKRAFLAFCLLIGMSPDTSNG